MIAHRLERFPAPLQCLAELLCFLELDSVDFRRVEVACHFAQLLCGIVFATFSQACGHVEGVDHAPGELLREFFHARVLEDIEDRSDCHLHGAARHVGIGHLCSDWSLDDVELGEIAMFKKRPVVGFRDPFTCIGEIDPCLSQICERVENSHKSLRFLKSSPHWEQPKTNRAGRTVSGTASSSRRRLGGRGGTDFLRGGWRAATQPPR